MRELTFNLGVVLYEMLAGRLPFAGTTASDVIAAILKTEPEPLSNLNREFLFDLERIVSKLWRRTVRSAIKLSKRC